MSLFPTNSFNKSSYKKPMSKKEQSDKEKNNNSSFLSCSKQNKDSAKLKVNSIQLNPKTYCQPKKIIVGYKEGEGSKISKEKRENKMDEEKNEKEGVIEIKENRIQLKNQNNEFNPNRQIKPRRNASVQQRRRNSNNINLNSFFPKPAQQSSISGIIGLTNEGQNGDFINAVIQCFSNNGRFRIGLLNLDNNNLSNKIITSSLVKVFKNLWLILNQRTYSPKKFIEILNKNLKSNYSIKEFIEFLLNIIHKELTNSNDSNLKYKNDFNLSHDYRDNINKFLYTKNIYEKLNGSIISKEFVGYLGILDCCEQCHQDNKITLKTFETLTLNIDNIIEKIQNNCVSIYQCFKYYERKLENAKCNKCNFIKYKKCDLLYMPHTLIITLNYGNKSKAKFIYEEYLNLTHYVVYNKESPYYYELVGIIVNLENNQNANHFISYCKNSNNCLWYKYDNDIVVRSSFIDVASHDQPSVLFYSYIEV